MLLITTPSVGRVKSKSKCKYKYIHASTNENTQTISYTIQIQYHSIDRTHNINYYSSVSLCVNRSGPVSILEELMKVFQSEYLFSIWNNQLIFFLCIFILFFVIFVIFFSTGRAAAHVEQLGLVDGGGRAVQGLPAQGPARADGKVQQGREEGTSEYDGLKLPHILIL